MEENHKKFPLVTAIAKRKLKEKIRQNFVAVENNAVIDLKLCNEGDNAIINEGNMALKYCFFTHSSHGEAIEEYLT